MGWDDYGENTPVVAYGPVDDYWCVYYRVCPRCGRYVKADHASKIPEYLQNAPNATCKKCGRVQMPFAYWWDDEENVV